MKKRAMNCFSPHVWFQKNKQNEFRCQNPNYTPSFPNLRDSSVF